MIKSRNAGFTLIELMVVITIILLLTSLGLANYRRGEEVFALERAAQKLAQDLRRTAQIAMAGKERGGAFPAGGYGIYFPAGTNSSYILFADLNGNSSYDGGDAVIENLSLKERGVRISSFSPGPSLSITFFPPNPTVTINPNPGSPYKATITLSLGGEEKKIEINKVGLIDILD